MGLADRLFGGDGEDENGDEDPGAEGGDFFGSGEGEDLGDMDNVDDWDGEDDGLDDFDDGDGADDLEPRLDELENEVSRISSTVSTVRSENEEISESVENMEENIRKLLDIYEMVTRGVNPFVDDVQQESMSEGTFGLFDSPEAAPETPEEAEDDEVMDVDADSFFDDDFDDEFAAEASDADPDGEQVADPDPDQEPASADGESGKTFDDLKEEYEGGDSEWSDEPDQANADSASEPEPEMPRTVHVSDEPLTTPREAFDEPVDAADEGWEFDDAGTDERENPAPPRSPEQPDQETDGEKPYLQTLPGGYTSDLVVMEWMAFLLSHADIRETLRAVRYYRTIGWISDDVADDLRTVVTGFEGRDAAATDGGGLSGLTIEHHTRSLEYIGRLEDSVDPEVITDWPERGGR